MEDERVNSPIHSLFPNGSSQVIFGHSSSYIMLPRTLRGFLFLKDENTCKAVCAVHASKFCVTRFAVAGLP